MSQAISRRAVLAGATALAASLSSNSARAQDWPNRPVRIVVGFAAGGNFSNLARLTADRFSEDFGQPFVVENRPGATGTVAGAAVARSEPDGTTLFWAGTGTISIYPAMNDVPYEVFKDLVPVGRIATSAQVLVVNPKLPVHTVDEFVAYVKARPGKLAYAGGGGPGSVSNLLMAYFLRRNGLDMVGTSYRGSGLALTAVVGGHIPAMFIPLPEALPQAEGGNVRILAIADEQRDKRAPDVPTLEEAGHKGMRGVSWNGMFAPAGTPDAVIDKLGKAFITASSDPKFVEQLDGYGANPAGMNAEQFATFLKSDMEFWHEAVAIAGLAKNAGTGAKKG